MDYSAARQAMVESQIRTNKVTDERLIQAFREIPREKFLPLARQALAYSDQDIEIKEGRYLPDSMILARLIQSLNLKREDMVLVVGAANGYSSAILAQIAGTVIGLDNDPALLSLANDHLRQLGIDTVITVEGSLAEGCARHAPYDAILLDGSTEIIPAFWLEQLAEGGRLAALVKEGAVGRGILIEKKEGKYSRKTLFDAWSPILPGLSKTPAFVF